MPPIMNRRSSLAISALLNNESIEPRMMASAATNRQSGSVSPATTNSNMDSGDTTPISSIVSSKTNGTSNGIVNSSQLSRHKRKRTTPAQFTRLMEIFDQTDTPSSEVRKNLATELNMDEREVQVWFQNRRAKVNRSRKNGGSLLSAATTTRRQRQSSLVQPTAPPLSSYGSYHGHSSYAAAPISPPFLRRASALPVMETSTSYQHLPPLINTSITREIPQRHQPSSYSPSTSTPITPTTTTATNTTTITNTNNDINTITHTYTPSYHSTFSSSFQRPPTATYEPPLPYHSNSHLRTSSSAIDLLASAAEYVGTGR